jgi:rhodanese-related sulfurtransferase
MADDISVQMLTPQDVLERLIAEPHVMILDVRTEEEWRVHHIPGATLVPMHTLRARLPDLSPGRETIVVCEHGMRSLSVAQYLVVQAGFQRVGNMLGGMSEWTGEVSTG